ncbi:hypothetical protein GCM10007981_08610 [Thermocladium modestius]|uniref:Uncharacterized protein n=1 Tax=Thermocladium modestius TaxID=62609 RepID=A0A830GTH4_9CREN|nr:hypothetical protein [Thermocladium modestius]GGP20457.1 hypothetical protein GCM10007981_08610 [Thermocladium modestius]
MRYPLAVIYYVDSALIVIISLIYPVHYWWSYSMGELIAIKDSPFYLSIMLLGKYLLISRVITVLLMGFALYILTVLAFRLYESIFSDEPGNYSTMFWLPILYILDPVIIYLVLAIALPRLAPFLGTLGTNLSGFSSYPLLIIGSEQYVINMGSESLALMVDSQPTLLYWISLTAPALYIASLIERRRSKRFNKTK